MIDVKLHWKSIAFYIIQTCEHKFQLCLILTQNDTLFCHFFKIVQKLWSKIQVQFVPLFFLFQNVDKIYYGQHVICTDGRVTGNKSLFLFGLGIGYIAPIHPFIEMYCNKSHARMTQYAIYSSAVFSPLKNLLHRKKKSKISPITLR